MPSPEINTAVIVAGRSCGSCTLCCKVIAAPELDKPAGRWCVHCRPGQGCAIHDRRPQSCRSFNCLWLLTENLGPEWKPERAKFVMSIDQRGGVVVTVDSGAPLAWRAEPYYSRLKVMGAAGAERGQPVIVVSNRRGTMLLADRDVDLGPVDQAKPQA